MDVYLKLPPSAEIFGTLLNGLSPACSQDFVPDHATYTLLNRSMLGRIGLGEELELEPHT
jgi:hypothetical protein